MLGNKSFINGETLFEYGKFKILYSRSHNSYCIRYGDLSVPDHAGEGIEHLDCLCEILNEKVKFAGIETDEILKGLGRFRISNHAQERKKEIVKFA